MFHRIVRLLVVCALAALASAPVHSAWYEASSDHFVIYADDKPKDLQRYAENLERYHSAMEFVTQSKTETPTPANRVVIFVVGSKRDIRRIAGTKSRSIAGFYIPRAGASRAFVQDIRNKNGYPDFSTIVLLHEYAHHFLMSRSRFAMPRWMSEGAAEFFASAGFMKDGTVMIGRPAQHRGAELAFAADVSVRELFDYDLYLKNKSKRYDAFYGRSWLLYHYLTFTPERAGQMNRYSRELITGTPPMEAAQKAFGDFAKLEKDLSAYQRKRRMFTFSLTPEKLNASPVSLRKLPEGEAKVMPLRIRSQRGVNEEQAAELVEEVRAVAAKYPNDAGVLAALAEAEYDAGNDTAAITAADKTIAIDPSRTNAYVQKGYALFRMAEDADDEEAAYELAMAPFTALNKIENDHPMPLIYYYRSYARRGVAPPENARLALERAAVLSPFDKSLWFDVAVLQMQEGKIALAKQSLQPLANDPHGGRNADRMRGLVAMLDKMPEGKPVDMRRAMSNRIDVDRTVENQPPQEEEAAGDTDNADEQTEEDAQETSNGQADEDDESTPAAT